MKKLILSTLVVVLLIGLARATLTPINLNGDLIVSDSLLDVTWADAPWQWEDSPASIVARLNAQHYAGYTNWTIPTGDGLYTTSGNGMGNSTDGIKNQLSFLFNNELNNGDSFNTPENFGPFVNLKLYNIGSSSGFWRYDLFQGFNYLYSDSNYNINTKSIGTVAVRAGQTIPFSITSQPTNVSLTATNSQTATFSVVATNGVPPYAYQWMKDGVDLTNQTNVSLVLSNAAANTVGYYSCDVTDQNGTTITSSNAALNIAGVDFNLWQGLVAYYPFDGNANDASGNGNNGTVVGGTEFTMNRLNKPNSAIRFDGTSGYVRIHKMLTPIQSGLTWSCWFKPGLSSITNHAGLLSQGRDPDTWGLSPYMWINFLTPGTVEGGRWNIRSYQTTGVGLIGAFTAQRTSWDTNHWCQVVYACDTFGNGKIYFNGALQGANTNAIEYEDDGTFTNFYIGAIPNYTGAGGNPTPNDTFFNGAMSDIRVYNRSLSSNEVTAGCVKMFL